MNNKTFASDNYAGVHPVVMDSLAHVNRGHAPAYGADKITQETIGLFKKMLGNDIEVFFVYNGTGANVLGLSAATASYHAIICSDLAHINVDESTAPQKFTGCKLSTIPTQNGKIYPSAIEQTIVRLGDQHHPQYKVISISQVTEYGTVYTIDEIKAISKLAKRYNFLLHMDGSRISNAAISLNKDFIDFTGNAGVDILSFGGTKNGMMFGEAVIFFNKNLSANFQFIRKQGMQLHSKMRFISAQFNALLSNGLWGELARHANKMASILWNELKSIPAVQITQPVEANSIFAILPGRIIPLLQEEYFFYMWDEKRNEVRLMCSFDTTENEVNDFITKLKRLV